MEDQHYPPITDPVVDLDPHDFITEPQPLPFDLDMGSCVCDLGTLGMVAPGYPIQPCHEDITRTVCEVPQNTVVTIDICGAMAPNANGTDWSCPKTQSQWDLSGAGCGDPPCANKTFAEYEKVDCVKCVKTSNGVQVPGCGAVPQANQTYITVACNEVTKQHQGQDGSTATCVNCQISTRPDGSLQCQGTCEYEILEAMNQCQPSGTPAGQIVNSACLSAQDAIISYPQGIPQPQPLPDAGVLDAGVLDAGS